jgi:hypothetical protein
MTKRKEVVEKQWAELEARLCQEKHEAFTRLIPLFTAAKNHPLLKQLFPYTSHEFLCFSFKTAYPWSADYPCAGPIPTISEFSFLLGAREMSDFKTSAKLLQSFVNKYQFLRLQEQHFIVFDTDGTIISLPNLSGAVDWILEQTQGMYTVFGNSMTDLHQNQILGILETRAAIDLLVERTKSL